MGTYFSQRSCHQTHFISRTNLCNHPESNHKEGERTKQAQINRSGGKCYGEDRGLGSAGGKGVGLLYRAVGCNMNEKKESAKLWKSVLDNE